MPDNAASGQRAVCGTPYVDRNRGPTRPRSVRDRLAWGRPRVLCCDGRVWLTVDDLEQRLRPAEGWPGWVTTAPYRAEAHPQAANLPSLEHGANCQRYAYGILNLFGRLVQSHRSSELWGDPSLTHHGREDAQNLDLALFNDSDTAWGAHVAVVIGDELLHLCAEEGQPAFWSWCDFVGRRRYERVIGLAKI